VLPPVDQRERAGQPATRVTNRAHTLTALSELEIDRLLADHRKSEAFRTQEVLALRPAVGETAGLQRIEGGERRGNRAEHRRIADCPPRGIRSTVEVKFEKHAHGSILVARGCRTTGLSRATAGGVRRLFS